jgi:hypothetical protein
VRGQAVLHQGVHADDAQDDDRQEGRHHPLMALAENPQV